MEAAEVFTGSPGPVHPSQAEPAGPPERERVIRPDTRPGGEGEGDALDGARARRHRGRGRGGQHSIQNGVAPERSPEPAPAVSDGQAPVTDVGDGKRASCTMAQMRRFIKSRPYVPIHELRRRFEIEGCEDDVHPVLTDRGTIYVGLPPSEARFLADLIKAGEVGCELLLDPCSPAVVGVYAMRPVARQ
jgi:hypothetical protein